MANNPILTKQTKKNLIEIINRTAIALNLSEGLREELKVSELISIIDALNEEFKTLKRVTGWVKEQIDNVLDETFTLEETITV